MDLEYGSGFEKEFVGAAPGRRVTIGRALRRGKHNHHRPRQGCLYSPGRFQAVDAGHIHVHDDHFGFHFLGFFYGFFTVLGFTNNRQISLGFQHPPDENTKFLIIISDKNPHSLFFVTHHTMPFETGGEKELALATLLDQLTKSQ
jgi:hypothetical protein